jgi:hypothetical protein
MALTIVQQPLNTIFSGLNTTDSQFFRIPAGQQLIFAVSDDNIVATAYNVKYLAEVHVSDSGINLTNDDNYIGTFKTTPNNAGVGIFDLRPILETFVKPDNDAHEFSSYKLEQQRSLDFPMHLIDRFGRAENGTKFFAINFKIEYSLTETSTLIQSDPEPSLSWLLFNGVLQPDDVLTLKKGNYGYDLSKFTFYDSNTLQFLSNAPTTQYARLTDYGTIPFFNWTGRGVLGQGTPTNIDLIIYEFFEADGSSIGSSSVGNTNGTGGIDGYFTTKDLSNTFILYAAMGPANIRQWNAGVDAWFAAGNVAYYEIKLLNDVGDYSTIYTVNIICPNLKGYEGIRLTWLNQCSLLSNYTFTMKSTRSVTTKRIPYTQQAGTWNESKFKIKGWKGGKKNFRVNSTEKIKLNTDFVTEAEGVWFEELINSPEVYIVNEYDATEVSPYNTITNKYVEPVTLTTSSYIKKTIANDRLMQYTFEIEKSKMQRTQAV